MEYSVAQPSDCDEIVRLLATVFSASDPPAVAMALSAADMEQFLRLVVPDVIPQGLTIVARSPATGKLAGALLTDDFASPPAPEFSQIHPKLVPILSLLEVLDAQFREGRTIMAGTCLHLFMLGVDEAFAGQGIGQGLVKACVENGLRRDYRSALTEATGKVSQHIFRKNGFAERCSVAYRDFLYDSRPVFASIRDHEKAILMDRSLA